MMPAAEVPAAKVSSMEVSDTEVPAAELSAVDGPAVDEPAAEDPAAEGPVAVHKTVTIEGHRGDPEEEMTISGTKSLMKVKSAANLVFHIPALAGNPHANRSNLRQRAVLVRTRPQTRKIFALKMYAVLSCQLVLACSIASIVTIAILRGWMPQDMPRWWWSAGFPINTIPVFCPAWFCQFCVLTSLNFMRGLPFWRRPLLVVSTLFAGVNFGLLTYLDDNAFGTLLPIIVLVALTVHVVGICMNFVSWVSNKLPPVKPTASKMEVMLMESSLTGTEKLICMLNDEEAVETRAALIMGCISWVVASLAVASVGLVFQIHIISLGWAIIIAGASVVYSVYGVEKQLRRCNKHECEKAIVNLNVDLFYAMALAVAIDLSIMKWQELGTAKPFPVKNSSFRSVMMQMSRTTSATSDAGRTASQNSRSKASSPRVPSVAV